MSPWIEQEFGPPGRFAAGLFSPAATHRAGDGHALLAPVLVLNASYEPINVCAARRALVLVLKGVAMTEEENGHFLHAARIAMRVPSVIRLLEYRRIPHQSRALSRKNILLPDRNTGKCCGRAEEYFSATRRGSDAGCGDTPAVGSPRARASRSAPHAGSAHSPLPSWPRPSAPAPAPAAPHKH